MVLLTPPYIFMYRSVLHSKLLAVAAYPSSSVLSPGTAADSCNTGRVQRLGASGLAQCAIKRPVNSESFRAAQHAVDGLK